MLPAMTNRRAPRSALHRAGLAVACAALAATVLVGCSSDGGSSAGDATTNPTLSKDPACVALRKLKKTVVGLTRPGLITGGQKAVDEAAAKVKRDLKGLRDAVDDDLKPSVD